MSPQESIAHYRITSKLGEGGMGAVYRATDTKLNREVAIKVLPDSFAEDADRLTRFTREAQVLASLNHPNIAAIYGVEERALVMELVEGQTLAGPLSADDALSVIHQLIDALEYAHEKGIVHRDLKPANIKVTPEGRVKVLDFGLAKAMSDEPSPANPAASPTLTMRATVAGMILGTAAYMSPEQARGQSVDRRADIWAFGVVMYELLTGRLLFDAPTVSDTLAGVLRGDLDLEAVPTRLRRLLRLCLDRDPRKRLRDISGARLLLEEPAPAPALVVPAARSSKLPWVAAGGLAAALAAVSFAYFRQKPVELPGARFTLQAPRGFSEIAVSPDGRQILYNSPDSAGRSALWLRPADAVEARMVPGTEGAVLAFWSPDSRSYAYFIDGTMKKADIAGGPPQTLCGVLAPRGGTWSAEGNILYATVQDGVRSISASGGSPKVIAAVDRRNGEVGVRWPVFLPDGRHFLFSSVNTYAARSGMYVGSLDSSERIHLLPDETNAAYTEDVSGRGFLLFARGGVLMAQRFDPGQRKLSGEPQQVAEGVRMPGALNPASFSSSGRGVVGFLGGSGDTAQLSWLDRSGKSLGVAGEPGMAGTVRLSPDEKRIAVARVGQPPTELQLFDFARELSSRFTFNRAVNLYPVWSVDGRYLYWSCNRGGTYDIVRKASSGAGEEELVLHNADSNYPTDISPDGRILLFTRSDVKLSFNVWLLPLGSDSSGSKAVPILETPAMEQSAAFSPDGKWIVYSSDESGRNEIYLRAFSASGTQAAATGGQWQVSRGGGLYPKWRADGKELYYWAGEGKITAVRINLGITPQIGAGTPLFSASLTSSARFAVTRDGQRFLVPVFSGGQASPATVLMNWNGTRKQ